MMNSHKKAAYQNVCSLLSALQSIQEIINDCTDEERIIIDTLAKFSRTCKEKMESTY